MTESNVCCLIRGTKK